MKVISRSDTLLISHSSQGPLSLRNPNTFLPNEPSHFCSLKYYYCCDNNCGNMALSKGHWGKCSASVINIYLFEIISLAIQSVSEIYMFITFF